MTDGCIFNHRDREGFFQRQHVPLMSPSRVAEVDIVNGCCLMVSAAVIRKIGIIDERFFLVHEESDFCLRAREAGFRCGILSEALVWHKRSSIVGGALLVNFDRQSLKLKTTKFTGAQLHGCRSTNPDKMSQHPGKQAASTKDHP
jgi:GT2 family glycosyltransferase